MVTEDTRFTLALTVVKPGEKTHHVLERLLNRVKKMVEIECVVADAGFYSVQCIKLLEDRGLSYVIHGWVPNRALLKILLLYVLLVGQVAFFTREIQFSA